MNPMRYLKFAVTVLAVAMLAGVGLATPQPAQAQDSGPYKVCSDIPWPPFEMTHEGEFFGFDLAIMRSVAAVEGYEINITNLSFDSIIPSLRAGKCDIGASGFTITEKRDRVIDYSDPYYLSNQAVVVRSEGKGSFIDALTGHGQSGAIGAQRGTTGAAWIRNHLVEQGYPVDLKLYSSYPLAILDLVNGRIDAVVQDLPASKSSIASHPKKLTVGGVIRTYEYFGFTVQSGDPHNLLPRINEGLKKLGLNVVDTATGWALHIQPDSPFANLSAAYFGPDNKTITAAWNVCKQDILNAESMADVEAYAQCMAKAVKS